MFLINYLHSILPYAVSFYQAGFYMIQPRGYLPYIQAKYNIELPGM